MMTRNALLWILVSVIVLGCKPQEATIDSAVPQAEKPQPSEPVASASFDQAWVMSAKWEGYMGVAIALTPSEFLYWFYSDASGPNEPTYPIKGTYTLTDGTLTLEPSGGRLYAKTWKVTENGGRKCLSAEDDAGQPGRWLIPDPDFDPALPFKNQWALKVERQDGSGK